MSGDWCKGHSIIALPAIPHPGPQKEQFCNKLFAGIDILLGPPVFIKNVLPRCPCPPGNQIDQFVPQCEDSNDMLLCCSQCNLGFYRRLKFVRIYSCSNTRIRAACQGPPCMFFHNRFLVIIIIHKMLPFRRFKNSQALGRHFADRSLRNGRNRLGTIFQHQEAIGSFLEPGPAAGAAEIITIHEEHESSASCFK